VTPLDRKVVESYNRITILTTLVWGLVHVLSINRLLGNEFRHGSNMFFDGAWSDNDLLGHDQNLFLGLNRPGTWSWCPRGVAVLHPAVNTVVVLAMGMVAAVATTRTMTTTWNTGLCPPVAETIVPVQVALMALAKVLARSSGHTEGTTRKMEASMHPGYNKAVDGYLKL
jgi:hypothetical protein